MRFFPAKSTAMAMAALVPGVFFGVFAAGPVLGVGPVRTIAIQSTALSLPESAAPGGMVGRLRYLGGLVLRSPERRFGGLSGLAYDGRCKRLVAISDSGSFVLLYPVEEGDRLVAVREGAIAPILDPAGRPPAGKSAADAEEIALSATGDAFVFYEQRHRIAHFRGFGDCDSGVLAQKPVAEMAVAATAGWPANGGMEAATVRGGTGGTGDMGADTGGPASLLVISERATAGEGGRQGLELGFDGRLRSRFSWLPPAGYDPTAADWYRDGAGREHLLVLHRRLSLLEGFSAVVSEAVLDDGAWGADGDAGAPVAGVLQPVELARIVRPLPVDNMEGLAVRAEGGRIFLYLLSDDNFTSLEKTLLLKFELLPDGPDANAP